MLIFTTARDSLDPSVHPEQLFKPFEPNIKTCSYDGGAFFGISIQNKNEPLKEIGYYPNDDFYKEIIEPVANKLRLSAVGWETQEELDLWIRNESFANSVIAIEFDNATQV